MSVMSFDRASRLMDEIELGIGPVHELCFALLLFCVDYSQDFEDYDEYPVGF